MTGEFYDSTFYAAFRSKAFASLVLTFAGPTAIASTFSRRSRSRCRRFRSVGRPRRWWGGHCGSEHPVRGEVRRHERADEDRVHQTETRRGSLALRLLRPVVVPLIVEALAERDRQRQPGVPERVRRPGHGSVGQASPGRPVLRRSLARSTSDPTSSTPDPVAEAIRKQTEAMGRIEKAIERNGKDALGRDRMVCTQVGPPIERHRWPHPGHGPQRVPPRPQTPRAQPRQAAREGHQASGGESRGHRGGARTEGHGGARALHPPVRQRGARLDRLHAPVRGGRPLGRHHQPARGADHVQAGRVHHPRHRGSHR
jgi:hypothetical protein